MRSKIFYEGKHKEIQSNIKQLLNVQQNFLSSSTAKSTRAVGDHFQNILGSKLCENYSANFARRAMADLAFEDRDKNYYIVDVKTLVSAQSSICQILRQSSVLRDSTKMTRITL